MEQEVQQDQGIPAEEKIIDPKKRKMKLWSG